MEDINVTIDRDFTGEKQRYDEAKAKAAEEAKAKAAAAKK